MNNVLFYNHYACKLTDEMSRVWVRQNAHVAWNSPTQLNQITYTSNDQCDIWISIIQNLKEKDFSTIKMALSPQNSGSHSPDDCQDWI